MSTFLNFFEYGKNGRMRENAGEISRGLNGVRTPKKRQLAGETGKTGEILQLLPDIFY